jgi:hypothetical protein
MDLVTKNTYVDDDLLAGLSEHQTSSTPREVIHTPEGIERKEKREIWYAENIEDHPPDHIPLAPEDEDEGLYTIDRSNHDKRERGDRLVQNGSQVDEVDDLRQ